jgi:hypothetical protein
MVLGGKLQETELGRGMRRSGRDLYCRKSSVVGECLAKSEANLESFITKDH